MSMFLPLLLAGALVSSAAPGTTPDDKSPRTKRVVVIDTAAHRQIATDLVARAHADAEGGNLNAARAELLTANTMMREAGGLEQSAVYGLVHIDYALDRYTEAAELLNEFAEQAWKTGNVKAAATATADAAELFSDAGQRMQAAAAVVRLRAIMSDSRLPERDRIALKKRLG